MLSAVFLAFFVGAIVALLRNFVEFLFVRDIEALRTFRWVVVLHCLLVLEEFCVENFRLWTFLGAARRSHVSDRRSSFGKRPNVADAH